MVYARARFRRNAHSSEGRNEVKFDAGRDASMADSVVTQIQKGQIELNRCG